MTQDHDVINEQTAFETGGIPTPPGQENIASTDMIDNAVAGIMDNITETIAPGMNTHDELEEKATEEEVRRGDYTPVTRLYLDRTPEE